MVDIFKLLTDFNFRESPDRMLPVSSMRINSALTLPSCSFMFRIISMAVCVLKIGHFVPQKIGSILNIFTVPQVSNVPCALLQASYPVSTRVLGSPNHEGFTLILTTRL